MSIAFGWRIKSLNCRQTIAAATETTLKCASVLRVLIFLQHMEQTHLAHVATKHKIIEYFRYVDDILLIYDSNHTDIQEILTDFNTIHPNLKFTAETESDNRINYLDITIHRTPTDWKIQKTYLH